MSGDVKGPRGHQFRSVSIRKIENGWVSSTTSGDAHGARSVERFHAKKPALGAVSLHAGPAKAPAPRAGKIRLEPAWRDPAQRPKRGV
jgi:hypothetical protein